MEFPKSFYSKGKRLKQLLFKKSSIIFGISQPDPTDSVNHLSQRILQRNFFNNESDLIMLRTTTFHSAVLLIYETNFFVNINVLMLQADNSHFEIFMLCKMKN